MSNAALAQSLIRAVDEAASAASLLEAVQQLAAARLEETVPNLIATLSYNNPGAAVAAVDGLVAIGRPAVQPLLDLLDSHNYTARAWAIRALAGIGDPRGLDELLDAAQNDFALSVRRAAARGLGTLHWHELASDRVQAAQTSALAALLKVCQDPEWVVRYAAITGLQALATAASSLHSALVPEIHQHLQHLANTETDLTVRTRIYWAQQQLQTDSTPSQTPVYATDIGIGLELDWQRTVDNLYQRKFEERSHTLPEGDPRRYRKLVEVLQPH